LLRLRPQHRTRSSKAETLRQCRFEPDCFYAIVKKDLVKVRFSDIQRTERPTRHDIIFRADRVQNRIIDYYMLDENLVSVLSDFQITVFD